MAGGLRTTSELGVVVPDGDPGALHDAGSALTRIGRVLGQVGDAFVDGPPVYWRGSASMNFHNACVTEGAVASAGAEALSDASRALHGLARELSAARKACRHQVVLAREAKERGDRARAAATQAAARAVAARAAAVAAAGAATAAEVAGLPSTAQRSAQAQSADAAAAADGDVSRHTSEARIADEALEKARTTAQERADDYEASARRVAKVLSGIAGQAPTVTAVNGHPVAVVNRHGRSPDLVEVNEAPDRPGGISPLVHGGLDLLGLVPGVGELADGANALIYTAEGDGVNAAISAAAMVPILGAGATAGKLGAKGAKAAEGAKGASETVDGAKGASRVPNTGITTHARRCSTRS